MRNYQGRGKARLITLTETLIILHTAKTEFNNCFIIRLFVLKRYRLLIIAGSFADNSVGCVIARLNLDLPKSLARDRA